MRYCLQDHVFALKEDLHAAARRIDLLKRDSMMKRRGSDTACRRRRPWIPATSSLKRATSCASALGTPYFHLHRLLLRPLCSMVLLLCDQKGCRCFSDESFLFHQRCMVHGPTEDKRFMSNQGAWCLQLTKRGCSTSATQTTTVSSSLSSATTMLY